jgi:CHAT domain-containing protein/TolA-binding protein
MRDSSCWPDPEVLSAFVAGNLTDEELKMTSAHLLTCEDCRFIVREAARVEAETETAVAKPPRRALPLWLAAAAAAVLGIAYLGFWVPGRLGAGDPIAILVEAAPRDRRVLEPRLSGGFPWAPLRSNQREEAPALDAGQMKLVGAAGEVLERNADDPSPEGRHGAAMAHLVAGRAKEAARLLAILARSHPDVQTWNDLAAARYTVALQTSDARALAEALAAADAAIRLDPKQPEALFNRALIIEHLGVRQQARTAWERYLEIDRDSPWSREARQHLNDLAPGTTFYDELTRHYAELQRDPAAARALAARFPQEARVWGESEILGRWAEAVKREDHAAAEQHLRVARAFGEELAGSRGERMLQAAVTAVERVEPAKRIVLANAHLRFRAAQNTYGSGRPAEAERAFTQAAAEFELAGSPVALLARYFVANTLYDQGKIDESRARLESLHAAAPPVFPAYRAQLEWQLGLAQASRGKWGKAMRALKESIATFERLHETMYATSVREILAQVYDRIGDSRAAWHHRMVALQELGRSESLRLQGAIFAAARAASVNRDWPVSMSLLDLHLEMARAGGDELLYVETLLLRARLNGRLAHADAARADLAKVLKAIRELHDAAFVERAEAEYHAVEASLETSAPEAVALLTEAIDFHRAKGRQMFLPELLLYRGRALARLGRADEAAADFESGICDLEAQRLTLDGGEERWGMFAAADELFDEALSLALSRGDTAGAYAYSERGRARELLECLGSSERVALPVRSRDSVIIEYVSLQSTLVIFVVAHGEMAVVQESVPRTALEEEVERLAHSAVSANRAEFDRAAAELYVHLIAPVDDHIEDGTPLVFVPDGTLRDVSFAALANASGRYLVEEHSIVVTPSAAVHAILGARPVAPKHDLRLLLVAGATTRPDDAGYLDGASREAAAIEEVYGEVVKFAAQAGDPDVFAARAGAADVIHFVGHSSAGDSGTAALLTSGGGLDDRLDVRDIASSRLRQTRVVVLAACSTAEGEERAREGSISIARAFLAAGVPSVVATLWPIDDHAAADFFPRLHRHLARGLSPAEALRFAQLECIHRREAPPFMWAAVQNIGS